MTDVLSGSDDHVRPRDLCALALFTAVAILVHGYHPFVEDAEIYVPGIKQALQPSLYPFNSAFFSSHAHLTLFPNLIAASVRITHLPLEWTLLGWQFASIFMLLLACWHIGRLCFSSREARWGGVALVASLLTIPVAGTALYILDQYVNTRSLSAPAVLFIVINVLERKLVRAALWAAATAVIHPLMVVFGIAYAVVLWLVQKRTARPGYATAAALLPLSLFPAVTPAYRQVLESRSYFFLLKWEWYEWLGIFGPLALLWWFSHLARRRKLEVMQSVCESLIWFGLFFFLVALAITIPPRFANLAELQPMRSLLLVYILLFIIGGGLLQESFLKRIWWRWLLLFVPLAGGMWFAQRQLFPSTPHIEWPGRTPTNEWVQAFDWIRQNTPNDAYFALDPEHMEMSGEDQHGFRAIAERSMLADRIKDSGAVTMFPALAETWQEQQTGQQGWQHFRKSDFEELRRQFGVTWVVVSQPPRLNECPYRSQHLAVSRID